MAIYSLHVSSIGRTTHKEGTAGAHLEYIARPSQDPVILTNEIPEKSSAARTWMDREERLSRKNARLLTKITVASPRELTREQQTKLIEDFCKTVTSNKVPWYAALHDAHQWSQNPHAHIAIRDRDLETGKRVLMLTDKPADRQKLGLVPNGVEWIRERWEALCNKQLAMLNHDVSIDRRTLKAQGVMDRDPQLHIGPEAQQVERFVKRPVSQNKPERSWKRKAFFTAPARGQTVPYPDIDAGKTRLEANKNIIDLAIRKNLHSHSYEARTWAKFHQEQNAKDRILTNRENQQQQEFNQTVSGIRNSAKVQHTETMHHQKAKTGQALKNARETLRPEIAELKEQHETEKAEIAPSHSRQFLEAVAGSDDRKIALRELLARQQRERDALAGKIKQVRKDYLSGIVGRYKDVFNSLDTDQRQAIQNATREHAKTEKELKAVWAKRKEERQEAWKRTHDQIEEWKSQQQADYEERHESGF